MKEQTYSLSHGASLLMRLFSSASNLYIASCGDISEILFVNENDLSAVPDDDDMVERKGRMAVHLFG